MSDFELLEGLVETTPSKIILLVIDGLGGLPSVENGKTELETAVTPNLDKLAYAGNCGLTRPVGPGITPGSAPGHLAIFGYDPIKYAIGRGVLEALGIDFDLQAGDIAARGNFCTVDNKGSITDRRAGRISTEKNTELCRLLDGFEVDGVKIIVKPVKEHRFIMVMRGSGLDCRVSDTDPQFLGAAPLEAMPLVPSAQRTAGVVNGFTARAKEILAGHSPANMLLLRGFSERPHFPSFSNIYRLKAAAIASYPMYRGLAKVVGMAVLPTGLKLTDEIATLTGSYGNYNFFFLHIKGADAAGEDGDFSRKLAVIEEVDRIIPQIRQLNPDVLIVGGDHSTPALIRGHSWHEVPCIIHSKWCRPDKLNKFGEANCRQGGLGILDATDIMPLALAHAQKLKKYGA